MRIQISSTKDEMARRAARKAAEILQGALYSRKKAYFIAATGASQFEFLEYLTKIEEIDWNRTAMFHLDEYVGLPMTHPASFRRYLSERLVDRVHPRELYFIEGDAPDPARECERISALISDKMIDVAFIGIGENGHIAFNDPPADFETEKPYLLVELDKKCRQQQVGEGWFPSLNEVPQQAISMSIKQIMRTRNIICTVPDKRKACAVHDCLSTNMPISPMYPASILKTHQNAWIFLDEQAASLLRQ